MMIVVLTNEKYPMFERAISSQFMVNLMHKSTASIALFKKEEILEELRYLNGEIERNIDRRIREKEEREDDQEMEAMKIIGENGKEILNIISAEWKN